jgi:PIN domain nuclease of toxin-antitoxin system
MKVFLLDTHILIWLLTDSDKLNKNIREDVEYFQHPYFVSVESLREIVILQYLKKIEISLDAAISYLQRFQITILPIDADHVKVLEQLPIPTINGDQHLDPFDRMLIAQSVAEKYTIVSSDTKFPSYRNHGLKLLVNEI